MHGGTINLEMQRAALIAPRFVLGLIAGFHFQSDRQPAR
jgi:hypothetical protein